MSDAATGYPPPDLSTPQFTVRAVLTGMVLGGALSLCNVYMGLKIGWGFNMSITAALLSWGFWQPLHRLVGLRSWNRLENNINQTAASSAASISSAGFVAPIPALTLLTMRHWTYWELAIWTLSVALVGVVVAIGLRKQMLLVDKLPFPNGVAAGETLNEMYAKGTEAMARVKMLLLGAAGGAAMKFAGHFEYLTKIPIPGSAGGLSLKDLTFYLDPSPLFVAVGVIIGPRAGLSLVVGAVVAFGVMGPMLVSNGNVTVTPENVSGPLIQWLLWPGVAMMVAASLTSFAFSWRSVVAAVRGTRSSTAKVATDADEVPRGLYVGAIGAALIGSVVLQFALFGIGWGIATLGVFLTFVLAIVAARVSGETGITPVGAMGKVTQLTFGAISPGDVSSNLMAANVTGGAASQCADLLHDMKTGLMVGASPRLQAYAQAFGSVAGALCGAGAYIILVELATFEDPATGEMLHGAFALQADNEWAMPAVVQWKAVAEVFKDGFAALAVKAPGATAAMVWGAAAGMVLAIAEKILPRSIVKWIPSPTAIGLAFVVPAYYSIAMGIGGALGWFLQKVLKSWSARFLLVTAAGVVAGDSLTGVFLAIEKILTGG